MKVEGVKKVVFILPFCYGTKDKGIYPTCCRRTGIIVEKQKQKQVATSIIAALLLKLKIRRKTKQTNKELHFNAG